MRCFKDASERTVSGSKLAEHALWIQNDARLSKASGTFWKTLVHDALRRLHLHVAAPSPASWLAKCLPEALIKLFPVPPVLLCNVTFVLFCSASPLPPNLEYSFSCLFLFCIRLDCMFGDTLIYQENNSSSHQLRPCCSKPRVLVTPSSRHLSEASSIIDPER